METALERLRNYKREYLNIGITDGGHIVRGFGIPWEATAHAYSMKLPDLFFHPRI